MKSVAQEPNSLDEEDWALCRLFRGLIYRSFGQWAPTGMLDEDAVERCPCRSLYRLFVLSAKSYSPTPVFLRRFFYGSASSSVLATCPSHCPSTQPGLQIPSCLSFQPGLRALCLRSWLDFKGGP